MYIKEKYREIIMYLIFGALTTFVGLAVYFAILFLGENVLLIDPEAPEYYWVRLAAQIIHWIAAVLFAFFTNKKWVFQNAENERKEVFKQLAVFSASRLATLGLDTLITFLAVYFLFKGGYQPIYIFGFAVTADVISKLCAAVFVVISNYVLSKLLVFREK